MELSHHPIYPKYFFSLISPEHRKTLCLLLLNLAHTLCHAGKVTIFLVSQFVERTLFDDLPVVDDGETGAVRHRCQPVGDDDGSAANHDFGESLLDETLRIFIKSTGGLVKKQDRGVTDDSSCDSDTLLLTSR